MKQSTETRGRPRDALYAAVATAVKKDLAEHPCKTTREFAYDIFKGRNNQRARYLGFRQSTTYKELKEALKEQGYSTSLFFLETKVIIKVSADGKDV